jgi:hypothetical protein
VVPERKEEPVLKKLGLVACGVLIGAGVFGVMTASAAPQPGGVTYFDRTVSGHYVDTGNSGFSAGDQFVFHDVVKKGGAKGTNVGTVDGFCEITQTTPKATTTCTGTVRIGTSQLQIGAGGPNIGNSSSPFKVAITGGTGNYRTARGYAVVKPINERDSYITLYVIP